MTNWKSDVENIIARYEEFRRHNMNYNQSLYLVRIMFELNYHWFERYVSNYFHKIRWYKTKVIWWFGDGWIDIEWFKSLWHKEIHLAVQCKKWCYENEHIKKEQILNFDDNAKNWKETNKYNNTDLFFVTTTNASIYAKDKAKEKWIKILDCWKLLEMKNDYGLDNFKEDVKKRKNNWEWLLTNNNVKNIIHNYLNTKSLRKLQTIVKWISNLN